MLNKTIKGFTLIELMIALIISTILFIAIISIFVTNMSYYKKTFVTNKLNQQLIGILDVMSNDIRRAGYWQNANSDIGTFQNNNPFQVSGADISVNGAQNCILFSYDHDINGSLATINSGSDDERYGFKLNNGVIQGRTSTGGFSCTATDWENITDSHDINITALTFTLNTSTVTTGPGTRGIAIRSVDITVSGQLTSDATVTKTLTQHVRIRNDKFIP